MGKVVWTDSERIYSVEGDGVRVLYDEKDEQSPADLVLTFLDAVDVDDLEQQVLGGSWGGSPVADTIAALKEQARGLP